MGILDTPGIVAVDVKECKEPLQELDPSEFVLEPMYFRQKYSPVSTMSLRSGVLERLRKAREVLRAAEGCENCDFKIWDGYRSLHTQQLLYVKFRNELKVKHPEWTEDALRAATVEFVSYPSVDPALPAPHNTGGAVDLTIVDATGRELPMGTEFDHFDVESHTGHFATLDPTIHRNRLLLLEAMQAAGFVNYEKEWWHFSYGDQAWARETGADAAWYGSVEL